MLAGEDAQSARRARRRGNERVLEQDAFTTNTIKVGRLDNRITKRSRVRPRPVVGHENDDVRFLPSCLDAIRRFGPNVIWPAKRQKQWQAEHHQVLRKYESRGRFHAIRFPEACDSHRNLQTASCQVVAAIVEDLHTPI